MVIRRDDLQPGDRVSTDQYVSPVHGRLPHTKGKEKSQHQYSGGTIFYDHASGLVYLNHQVSLGAGDTVSGKHKFENFANEFGIKVKAYHADNQPFTAEAFLDDMEIQSQKM